MDNFVKFKSMKLIMRWFYNQALKDADIREEVKATIRHESIGYNNWTGSLHKNGFPKNPNGTMMDCWQLYDHWFQSEKRPIYTHHAKIFQP